MVEFSYKSRIKKHPQYTERNPPNAQHANSATSLKRKVCFSFAAYACTVISHLRQCNVPISRGLSDEEFQQIQGRFGFIFPPDLRSILQEGLPVGAGFPDWRSSPPKQLLGMIKLPAKGLCNEVLRGTFWCKHWGERPGSPKDAADIAKQAFKTAPVLVPIYSHCYIPCFPNLSGNPVFFIFRKDVFYCGYDLADFFGREVFVPLGSLFENSLLRLECPDEIVSKSMQARVSGQVEKRNNMGIVDEAMVQTESKLMAAVYNKNGGPLYHGDTHGGHHQSIKDSRDVYHHSQKQILQHNISHDSLYCHGHSHRRSDKEGKWDVLNKRLIAELQKAEAIKEGTVSRKSLCEEHLHCTDRPPKSLVRSAGSSPRMGQSIISRYVYFHDKPLPAKVLEQFTIAAPPWAAKVARHIPIWSDLMESKESACAANVQSVRDAFPRWPEHVKNNTTTKEGIRGMRSEGLFNLINGNNSQSKGVHESVGNVVERKGGSCCDVAVVQSNGPHDSFALHDVPRQCEFEFNICNPQCATVNQDTQGSGKPNRMWLVPYFKTMETTLRRGGWKHGEIEEMIATLPPDHNECFGAIQTRQAIHGILKSSTNAMFLSLQKAGWSIPDVEEILSF